MDLGADDGVVSTIPPPPLGGDLSWGWGWPLWPRGGLGGVLFLVGGLDLMSHPTQNAFWRFSCYQFWWRGVWGGGGGLALGGGVSSFNSSSPSLLNHHPPSLPTPPHPPPLCTPPVPSWPTPQPCTARRPPRPPSRPSPAPNPSIPLGLPTPRWGRPQAGGAGCPVAAPVPGCGHARRCVPAAHPRRSPQHQRPVKITRGEMIHFCGVFFKFLKLVLTAIFTFCAVDRKICY